MGGVTMWQVNPLLLREIETLRNKAGTNSWSNFAGCWLFAVDTRVLLVAVFIQTLTIFFVAAPDSRVVVEIQLWLTWVRVATAIPTAISTAVPLFTVGIQFMLIQFHLGWLHVSLFAFFTQLWLMADRTVITGTAAPDAFALRIAVGTNPFRASEGNVTEYNWQLQGQPRDVTQAASSTGGHFKVHSNARSCAIRARNIKHRVLRTHAMTMTAFFTCFIAMRGLRKANVGINVGIQLSLTHGCVYMQPSLALLCQRWFHSADHC